ncbi:cytochrome P450 [Coniochaeta ligniaria NRRL 30616]|uniref:Cytochrome P450 n=1 Tax=Coniochaeta ligniaria NRRL 30616 TaxID=1408157 RepID=A0A1J7I7M1_9PEZI|nr:cytochrome P450 [Coniochaeta ligniaria NRRL 30616]
MVSSVALLFGAVAAWAVYTYVSGLASNIAKARKANLPYIVVPAHPYNKLWQITFWIWVPLIKRLPKSWWEGWLFVLEPDWGYRGGRKVWEPFGENFLVVGPGAISLFTRNAETIRQVTARRELFPKDTTDYQILTMFGQNVLTTEGSLWRMHRKVTAASFNEKNAAHTFAESINQTHGLISEWLGPDGKGHKTITTAEHDTMTLALNIIGYVGFGLRLLWPGQTLPPDIDPKLAKYGSLEPPSGHTMSFAQALASTLEYLLVLLLVPWSVLKRLPFKWARNSWEAKENYMGYMDEFLQDKIAEVRQGEQPKDSMDIMGQLVRAKYGKSASESSELCDSDIIGNAFIIIVAGHETTANTLHFTFTELANNPAAQRALQKDVDDICGKDDPSTWNYESVINPLLASHLAAAMNETLRLMPAVPEIPKHVAPSRGDQVIIIDGEKHTLAAGMTVGLSAVSVQRNPRYWPTRPSKVQPGQDDLDDFEPERWFRSSDSARDEIEDGDTEDYGGFKGRDTSDSLFRPARGAFIPFSDGARSCLGRRIAQVEMLAALAVVFQKYSIELAVDEWASDDEVEKMSAEERRRLYKKAQDMCRATLRKASSRLTLKLHGGMHVPIRLVKRGEERFVNVVDTDELA